MCLKLFVIFMMSEYIGIFMWNIVIFVSGLIEIGVWLRLVC